MPVATLVIALLETLTHTHTQTDAHQDEATAPVANDASDETLWLIVFLQRHGKRSSMVPT